MDVETQRTTPGADLGRGLNALLQSYLVRARDAVADVPGGPRGFQVMQLADEQACTNQAKMAEALRVDRTAMTYLVDDLEKAGLIERQPDPADRRARRVLLTDAGLASLRSAQVAMRDVERQTLGALADDDASQLRTLLERAVQGLDTDHSACTESATPPC